MYRIRVMKDHIRRNSLAQEQCAFKLNSDVSDHSTVVIKGYGPKRVLCDCSRCRAMAKLLLIFNSLLMLILFNKTEGASA